MNSKAVSGKSEGSGILGRRLRELRKERGLNQGELADLAGINRSYLSMLENGLANPSLDVIDKLARNLGSSISKLTSGLSDGEISTDLNVEERHFVYDTGDEFDIYPGLDEFLSDEDEMLLVKPTAEEIEHLKGIRFSRNHNPSKRFYRDALLDYRRRNRSNSSDL